MNADLAQYVRSSSSPIAVVVMTLLYFLQVLDVCRSLMHDLIRCLTTNYLAPPATLVYQTFVEILRFAEKQIFLTNSGSFVVFPRDVGVGQSQFYIHCYKGHHTFQD